MALLGAAEAEEGMRCQMTRPWIFIPALLLAVFASIGAMLPASAFSKMHNLRHGASGLFNVVQRPHGTRAAEAKCFVMCDSREDPPPPKSRQ